MDNPCLEPLSPQRHISALQTPFGPREVYDAVSFCNRCGMCAQVCPTYRIFSQESFSPRGRNQILRLALEGKIKLSCKDTLLTHVLQTCTLCGRCSRACAAAIPTAEHVLEMRRSLRLRVLPYGLNRWLAWRETAPRFFENTVRLGLFLRRLGFCQLLRKTKLTRIFGCSWVDRADEVLPSRTPALRRILRKAGISLSPEHPTLIYIPSLEAQFFLPDIALQTWRAVSTKYTPLIWLNTPSGLFSYVYGDLRQSRKILRQLITRHAKTADGKLPLVTDSIDVYHFLQRAPQLFAGNALWEQHARGFAQCVRFVSSFLTAASAEKPAGSLPVQLEYGALFERQGKPFEQAQHLLGTLFGKNLVHCLYTDADIPVLGYGFTKQNCAEEIGLAAVKRIARTQTKQVFALSGFAALELAYFLKRFYPAARVEHLVSVNKEPHARPYTREGTTDG